MSDPTSKPAQRPTGDRLIRAGLFYLAIVGLLYLIPRLMTAPEEPAATSNLVLILESILPAALVCTCLLLLAGFVIKFKSR